MAVVDWESSWLAVLAMRRHYSLVQIVYSFPILIISVVNSAELCAL